MKQFLLSKVAHVIFGNLFKETSLYKPEQNRHGRTVQKDTT